MIVKVGGGNRAPLDSHDKSSLSPNPCGFRILDVPMSSSMIGCKWLSSDQRVISCISPTYKWDTFWGYNPLIRSPLDTNVPIGTSSGIDSVNFQVVMVAGIHSDDAISQLKLQTGHDRNDTKKLGVFYGGCEIHAPFLGG